MSGNELESTAVNAQVQAMTEAIIADGYRLTAARQVVIECLIESGGHISADDLAARVQKADSRVGRMTVFRTLELLSGLGIVRPIYQGTGAAHYILMQEGSHHHLVCTRCHRVIDFDSCGSRELADRLGKEFNFQVRGHLLEIHGLCALCRD